MKILLAVLVATLAFTTVTPTVEAAPEICAGAYVAVDGSVDAGPILGCGGVACGYGYACVHCWIVPRTGQCTAS